MGDPGARIVFMQEWNDERNKWDAFNVMEDDQSWRLISNDKKDEEPTERGAKTIKDEGTEGTEAQGDSNDDSQSGDKTDGKGSEKTDSQGDGKGDPPWQKGRK